MVNEREPMDFDMRLQKARDANNGLIKNKKDSSSEQGKSKAMRISTELIVSVIVGGCLGFFLDKWLGTKPWFLLGFLLLGNMAGLWNIYRIINGHRYKIGFKYSNKNSDTTEKT